MPVHFCMAATLNNEISFKLALTAFTRFKKIALFFTLFSAYLHQLHANDAWTNIIRVVVDHSSLEGRSSILQEPALLSIVIYKVQECKIQYRLLELHRKLQEVRPTVWPQLSIRPSFCPGHPDLSWSLVRSAWSNWF